jgi:hypothetical protein
MHTPLPELALIRASYVDQGARRPAGKRTRMPFSRYIELQPRMQWYFIPRVAATHYAARDDPSTIL